MELESAGKILTRIQQQQINTTPSIDNTFACGVCKRKTEKRVYHPFCSHTCARTHNRATKKIEFLRHIGAPPRYAIQSVVDFKPKNQLQKQAFAKITEIASAPTPHNGLVAFIGGAGAGKTHLGYSAMSKVSTVDLRPFMAADSTALLVETKKKINFDGDYDYIESVGKMNGWLLVDDFGADRLTDYTRPLWQHMINLRYNYMLPTIITSNMTMGDISDSYGDRVASRIASGIVISLGNDDYRIKK